MLNKTVLYCIYFLLPTYLHAQTINIKSLQKAIDKLNTEDLSYDYSLTLIKYPDQSTIDNLSGKFYKSKELYLDSNAIQINLRDESNTVQINNNNKTIYIKNIREIEKKMHHKIDASPKELFDFNYLFKNNLLSINSKNERNGNTEVHLMILQKPPASITIVLTQDLTISSISVRLTSKVDNNKLEKLLVMNNFSKSANRKQISSTRFIINSRHGYKGLGKYISYKILNII